MTDPFLSLQPAQLTTVLAPLLGAPGGSLEVETRELQGGLDSAGVMQLTVRFEPVPGRRCSRRLVLKRVTGEQRREARIYEEILGRGDTCLAPAVAAVHRAGDECWLLLEPIRRINNWPWRDPAMPASVLRSVARLHGENPRAVDAPWLKQWDYESELESRARELVRVLERLPAGVGCERLRRSTSAVRRLAADLPRWRAWMLELAPFGRTFIHGDVHPGNVLMRRRRGAVTPVFVDWGRSRIGSPLEDVSSWLQSLGYWEPSARQRHDTLLLEYLEARDLPRRLGRELRDAYWLAAASNLLAGAILYHLGIFADSASTEARRAAALASAADALRVIRRADACWRARAG